MGIILNSDEHLQNYVRLRRQRNDRIVWTNGCFDIVHAGHVKSLQEAKNQGDCLIVGINSDASIRRIKGEKRPIILEQDRAVLLACLTPVDAVVIFGEDTPEKVIRIVLPDVLVKGADWRNKPVAGQSIIEAQGGKIHFIDLVPGLSTTDIIEKIIRTHEKPA